MSRRPHTLTDFRAIGKRKLKDTTPEQAKRLHDQRQRAKQAPYSRYVFVRRDPAATFALRNRYAQQLVTIPLGQACGEIMERARAAYPQRKNWEGVRAVADEIKNGWRVETIDNGRYSSRCAYRHYSYRVEVRSAAIVRPEKLLFWFAAGRAKIIRAPRGYHWDEDANGARLVSNSHPSDDYHPTADDLLAKTPRQLVAALKANAKARKEQERQARLADRATKREKQQQAALLRKAEREGATVCVADSLRAGNCLAGTLTWASRHGLDTRRHYAPSQLLAVANGDASRVSLVVAVALRRHRTEMDRGFAIVAEHR